jgi:hypothetical protein
VNVAKQKTNRVQAGESWSILADRASLAAAALFHFLARPEGVAYISQKLRLDLFSKSPSLVVPLQERS